MSDGMEAKEIWGLLEGAPLSVTVCARDTSALRWANSAFFELFSGVTKEELLGSPLDPFFSRRIWSEVVAKLGKANATAETTAEIELPGGRAMWLNLHSKELSFRGEPCVMSFCTDITRQRQFEGVLRHNEENLRSILNNFPYSVWLKDINGHYLAANDAFLKLHGLAGMKELAGKTDFDLWPAERAAQHVQDDELVVRSVSRKHMEIEADRLGGAAWYEMIKSPIVNSKGEVIGTSGVLWDITEQKAQLAETRRLSDRLLIATESAGLGIFEWDLASGLLIFDERMYQIYGIDPGRAKIDFSDWKAMIHPDTRELVCEEIERTLREKSELDLEIGIVRSDGALRMIRANGLIQRAEDGSAIRVVGVNRDITEQRLAELQLAESERRFRDIFSNVQLISVMLDAKGQMTFVNDFLLAVTGYRKEELIGQNWFDIFVPDPLIRETFARAMREAGFPQHFENSIRTKSGSERWVRFSNATLRDTVGRIVGSASLGEDVTELKRAEAERERLLKNLSTAKLAAESASHSKTVFVSNITHEIRTPMHAMLGVSELLSETRLDPEQRNYVQMIRNAGDTLLQLINNVLDLSKIEAGSMPLESKPFDLCEILDTSADLLRKKAQDKGLGLFIERHPGLPCKLVGDSGKLKQVLVNLIGNAIKFTESGRVSVYVASTNSSSPIKMFRFEVTDTGIGIPKEKIDQLFQRFNQLDDGITRKFGGTGLGLSISRQIVELMGGVMDVRSRPGEGSTFAFVLPFEEQMGADVRAPSEVKTLSKAKLPVDDRPLRILAADDSEDNILLLKAYLRSTPYVIDVVQDGKAALERAKIGNYDLILMDVQMPVMDGLTATREIRLWEAAQGRKPIPIIALTAYAFAEEGQLCIAAGASRHLVKPVSRPEMLHAILQETKPR